MSEYQYYEFIAIDRPLTKAEMASVREFSTRADITATRFVNEYHWGDFKGDPVQFIKKYFDAMVYFANWGTRQFMFRLPLDLVDEQAIRQFESPEALTISRAAGLLICDFTFDDENGDRDEPSEDGLMSSLIGLRAEAMRGDYRGFYIAWLCDLQHGLIDDDQPEPPIPPGLNQMTTAQVALAEYLCVDKDLIHSAARDSAPLAASKPCDYRQALASVPMELKDRWLAEIVESGDSNAGARLRLLIEQATGGATPQPPRPAGQTRTVGQLRQLFEEVNHQREETERLEREARQRRAAAKAEAIRQQRIASIRQRLPQTWNEVERAIELRNDEGYKQAVALLLDLRDATEPAIDAAGFQQRVGSLMEKHVRKQNLISAMRRAGLLL